MKKQKVENKSSEFKNQSKSLDILNIQNLRIWLDQDGRLCLGDGCLQIMSDREKVFVTINEKCSISVEKLPDEKKPKNSEKLQEEKQDRP